MANINTAARKAPTKVERARNTLAKANASAAKKSSDASFEEALPGYLSASRTVEGGARVMAHIMNNDFADAMRDYRCHWSAFTTANCRTDNEKAILARVTERKNAMKAGAEAKGLVNVNKPWSDMAKVAKEIFYGGGARERVAKPLIEIMKADLLHAYKAAMKEERQTETEERLNTLLGDILQNVLKVDITKY